MRVDLASGLRTMACVVTLSVVVSPAAANCRTTTCDETKMDCQVDQRGCKMAGTPVYWPGKCVGFSSANLPSPGLSADDISRVFDRSLATWTTLACPGQGEASFSYVRMPASTCPVGYNRTGPNANVLVFRDDTWPYHGTGNTLAYTTVTFDTTTGEIFGADIEMNSTDTVFTISDTNVITDFESVLTHELGHALGLAHSDDPTATMYPMYTDGTTFQRSLAPDDIAAACLTYPPVRVATCDPTPRGGFAESCDPAPEFGSSGSCTMARAPRLGLPALLLAAAAAAARTRRRRGRS